MRVLLISSNTAITSYPVYPLGCSMIAAALENAKHEVRQFDFIQQDDALAALSETISEFKPGLIGVSIRNIDNVILLNEKYYIEDVKNIIKSIRTRTDVSVILGGAGFSLVPDLILKETGADYGIVGEGESLIVDFVNNAEKEIYPKERLIRSGKELVGKEIPAAKYDQSIIDYYVKKSNIISVQTKRGCIHNCVYCSYPVLEGKKIRPRDPRAVVDDVEFLADRYNVKHIFFVDSVFNDDDGVYLDVVEELRRRKNKVQWTAFFKPEGLNDEVIELMKEAGLASVEFGTDAVVDIIMKKMGKRFTYKDVVESNDLLIKHGISSSHYVMFGGPGETEETVLEGIEKLKALKNCVSFIFMGIRILPDTMLAEIAIKEGIISSDDGLLKSAYYISPDLDIKWLEETLKKSFSGIRSCVFPADTLDSKARILYELGCTGSLWTWLL